MSASDAARRRKQAGTEEEDPELLANKGALFGSRRGAAAGASAASASSSTGAVSESKAAAASEKKETDEQASRRTDDESKAALKALAEEMGGLDVGMGDGSELDEMLRAADGGGSGAVGSELDLTTTEVDFDGVDSDLARFQADPLVMEALRAGVDLRAYSAGIERDLAKLEQLCVEDYVSLARPPADDAEGADSLSALHGQLANCDGILESMEKMLTHFQSDLSTICGEIQSLQEKSYGMGVKLKNYKAAEKALHAFVDRAYIDDSVANAITNDKAKGGAGGVGGGSSDKEQPLDERFVVALQDLDVKLTFLTEQALQAAAKDAQNGSSGSGSHGRRHSRSGSATLASPPASMPPAARDMAPLAEKLRLHAVSRARAFLLERFHSLGVKRTNIQIKQQSLLKFAPLYQFLLHHADERGNTAGTGGGVAGGLRASASSSALTVPGTPSASGGALPPLSPGGSGLDICGEIRRSYHETLSKIYESKFERYLKEIAKITADNSVRAKDTLGSDDGGLSSGALADGKDAGGGMFSSLFGGRKSDAPIDPFRLGSRDEVLTSGSGADGSAATMSGGPGAAGDGDLIVPHLASSAGAKLPFERLFKSATALLMDTATSEYDFIVEFFGERMQRDMDRAGMHEDALAAEKEAAAAAGGSSSAATPSASSKSTSGYPHVEERGRAGLLPLSRDKDLFKLVFRPTELLFLRHLDKYLASCHDALSVLLLIRVVCQHNIAMQYRRVHCLDALFDRMNMTLWPKFKQIFDANVKSVIDLDAHPPAKEGGRRPHPLCTRYADFASGILRLNRGYDDAILTTNLARLSREVNEFLKRSAALAPSPRMQLVYVLNSHRTIMAVLAAGGSGSNAQSSSSAARSSISALDSDEYRFWQSTSDEQIGEYVKLELHDKFGSVILAIQAAEKSRNSVGAAPLPADVRESVAAAVHEFKLKWSKGIIAELHKRIHESFGYDDASAAAAASGGKGAGASAAKAGSAAASGAAAGAGAAAGGNANANAGGGASVESSLARAVFMKVVAELMMYNSRLEELAKKAELKQANLPTPTHFRMEILPFKQCCPI